MVKDRGRAENHHNFVHISARRAIARDYGADGQDRTTSVPLATREGTLQAPFQINLGLELTYKV